MSIEGIPSDYIDYVENRAIGIEAQVYEAEGRIADVAARVDGVETLTERFIDRWDYDTDIDILRNEIRDFKRQLVGELVAEIAATFKREFCIDYGPADEQEFLQNLQYLYT